MATEPHRRTPSLRAPVALTIIAGILSIGALYLGRAFFIPIAMALCFHALLRPVVRFLEGLRVPTTVGAALVVLGGLGLAVAGGLAISGSVQTWVAKAPTTVFTFQQKLAQFRRPFQRLTDAATGTPAQQPGHPAPGAPTAAPPAVSRLFEQVVGTTTALVAVMVEVLLLLYLLLAAGDLFLRKLVKVLPATGDKKTATDVLHATESIVGRYLGLTALINLGQGAAVAIAVSLLGMPDALLWGLLTFALEFVPYLGSATMVGLLLISAFTVFESVGHALLIPASYLVISAIQNNLVTPVVFGGRLKLNPVAVLVCVLFGWFLWGIPGAFLAIPATATLKALSDQVPRLTPLGELLGQ